MKLKAKGNPELAKRIGIWGLTCAVAVTMGVTGIGNAKPDKVLAKSSTQQKVEKTYSNLVKSSDTGNTLSKEETTYAIMDADGNTDEVKVSEWLKNGKDADEISDTSELKDIENTSGNEKYDKDGNQLTWKADGKDIHYTGSTDEKLPVEVDINYYLNGKKKSAKEIKGKSGDVEIRFNYKVNKKESVSVDGKDYTVTHPYTMASGVVLDGSKFTDVTVEGGKNINDGSNNIALGVAFPGLAGDLGLSGKLDIPQSVSIKAKTSDFKIDGTYTVAMSGVLGDLDESGADSIKSKVSELEKGLTQLSNSSKKLVSGSKKIANGARQLSAGAGKLKSGSKKLKNGTGTLKNGAGSLAAGANQLNRAVSGVSLPNVALTDQQKTQIQQQAANSAASNPQVTGAANQLTQGIASGVSRQVNSQIASTVSGASESLQKKAPTMIANMTKALMEKGLDGETAQAVATSQVTAILNDVNNSISGASGGVSSDQIASGISSSVTSTMQQVAGSAAGTGAVAGAQGVVDQVNSTMKSYSGQLNQLKQGTASLASGAGRLVSGAGTLSSGMNTLDNGIGSLAGGAGTLASGSNTLALGMEKFDKEGIQKLTKSLSDAELKDVADKFEAVVKASRDRIFVGGKKASMDGQSKIIFKTGEVK